MSIYPPKFEDLLVLRLGSAELLSLAHVFFSDQLVESLTHVLSCQQDASGPDIPIALKWLNEAWQMSFCLDKFGFCVCTTQSMAIFIRPNDDKHQWIFVGSVSSDMIRSSDG